MAEIRITAADGIVRKVGLDKERTTIGRSRDSDICLPDQWLSRMHAEIVRQGERFQLRDLGSKNGTLLNGQSLQAPHDLQLGDVISLGEHRLTFADEQAAADPLRDLPPAGTRVFSVRDLVEVAEKADAPERAERQARVLRVLQSSLGDLLQHRPLAQVFDQVLDLLFQAVPAERGAVLLTEGSPPQLVIKASRGRQGDVIKSVSRSISRRVLEDRVLVLIPNVFEDESLRAQDSILSHGIRSAICAPLWYVPPREAGQAEGEVIGVVYLDSRLKSHSFSEEDAEVVTALASVAAAKIENAKLIEESLEKRKMEQDIRLAAQIQRGLLPDAAPVLEGWTVAGSNRPSRAVGGDYYDFVLEDGRLLIALGDVAGKGTSAALLMTVLRAAVRANWCEADPAVAIEKINRMVCQNVPDGRYVTFFLATLDPVSGLLTYVNAGHNPPLVVRAAGSVERLEHGGTVLGMFETLPYDHGTVLLWPGDALAVFSDGVSETLDAAGDEYGDDRVAAVINRFPVAPASDLQDEILKDIDVFSAGERPTDDRTLVVVRRNPVSAPSDTPPDAPPDPTPDGL
jgi:sigma-B regulation protein RsbU (phosphoserine phosphatase)